LKDKQENKQQKNVPSFAERKRKCQKVHEVRVSALVTTN